MDGTEEADETLPALVGPDPAGNYLTVDPSTDVAGLEERMPSLTLELGGIFGEKERLKWSPRLGSGFEIEGWCAAELESLRNATFSHSHPINGGTFSAADLRTATKQDVETLRAVSIHYGHHHATYTLTRPAQGWDFGVQDEDVARYYAHFLSLRDGRPFDDAFYRETLEAMGRIRAQPGFAIVARQARTMSAFYAADARARGRLRSHAWTGWVTGHDRAVAFEKHAHQEFTIEFARIGVEYVGRTPDGFRF